MSVNRAITPERLFDRLLHAASPLAERGSSKPRSGFVRADAGAPLALPSPLRKEVALDAVFQRRAATRRFPPVFVDAARVGTILDAAKADALFGGGRLIAFQVIALRVLDVPAAIYAYDRETHALYHLATAPTPAEAQAMFRQEEFATAAAVIVAIGDLESALTCRGDHGYRLLLLGAGIALQRSWLAAVQCGLAGCLFEAPFARVHGRSICATPPGHIALLALGIGASHDDA